MQIDDPVFPPLLKPFAVAQSVTVMDHAGRLAAAGGIGAGDVVWSRALDRAEMAIVLEPEVALDRALQMAPLVMVALGDCLGALMPPKTAIAFRWPDTLLVNGAEAGRVRLAAPSSALDAIPDWLVVGIELRLKPSSEDGEPGERPDFTTLATEGGGGLTRTDILQAFAAHVLAWIDIWTHEGFEPLRAHWLAGADGQGHGLDDALELDDWQADARQADARHLKSWRQETDA
jgi:biotin-(acetyl-CoA carboxylase) ligase